MPRLRLVLVTVPALVLAACGGGSSGDADASFDANAKVLQSWSESGGVFTEQTLNTACLNTPSSDETQVTDGIVLNTLVTDFQTDAPLPGAIVTAFAGTDQTQVLGMATADAAGMLSITIDNAPAHTRFGFKILDSDSYDTFLLNQYLDPVAAVQTSPGTISAVSMGTGAAIPALVGISRTPGTGVLAGALRDCSLNELSNFTATVSSQSGVKAPVPNARTFYFQNGLPARNTVVPIANKDGLFAILELPVAATSYVQMWGYLTQADLDNRVETLLSELAVPVIGDNMITGSYELQRN